MRESEIEHGVNERVYPEGLIQVKIDGRGRLGWPDRMYLYRGRAGFIEYKRPGEKPTPIQTHIHSILVDAGFQIWVVFSIDEGVRILLDWKNRVDQELA